VITDRETKIDGCDYELLALTTLMNPDGVAVGDDEADVEAAPIPNVSALFTKMNSSFKPPSCLQ
jgi:hypothetical protein